MKTVYILNYIMALLFILGETLRRGPSYIFTNTSTMLEDYISGAILLIAAYFWKQKKDNAPNIMVGAWGYATGGMFIPFWAHLEACIRGETICQDHIYSDVEAIILKGLIWIVCISCFIITLKGANKKN